VDGDDLFAVYEATGEAIERARKGEGPTLVECVTYRNYGHFEGDEQKYKNINGEEKNRQDSDCIPEFIEKAIAKKLLTKKEAEEIAEKSTTDIAHAIKFAEESPVPRPEALYEDVFAD